MSNIHPHKNPSEDVKKVQPAHLDIACDIMFRRTFHIGDTYFTIHEVEIYERDDPYTHGHPEQLDVPPGQWYFHRASKNPDAKYKGGTYKGMDITIPGGGCLVRSVYVLACDAHPDGLFVEGSCKVVNWILKTSGCSTIGDFVHHNGVSVYEGVLLQSITDNTVTITEDMQNSIICGPRVGLGYKFDLESEMHKYKLIFAPRRFYTGFAHNFIKNNKSLMFMRRENGLFEKAKYRWVSAHDSVWNTNKRPKSVQDRLSAYGTWLRTEFD